MENRLTHLSILAADKMVLMGWIRGLQICWGTKVGEKAKTATENWRCRFAGIRNSVVVT